MKSYTVTYTRGHLIDEASGKRIFLKRNGQFILTGENAQFAERDDLKLDMEPKSAGEKLDHLKKRHKGYDLLRLAEGGQSFVYRIGISVRSSEDKKKEFLFQAKILEDLYMKSKKDDKYTLCNCICETSQCLDGDVQMFETVPGLSLSNLFSNMVAFFFTLQRSGVCNAFNTFYYCEHWEGLKLDYFKTCPFTSLGDERGKFIKTLTNAKELSKLLKELGNE